MQSPKTRSCFMGGAIDHVPTQAREPANGPGPIQGGDLIIQAIVEESADPPRLNMHDTEVLATYRRRADRKSPDGTRAAR